MNLSVIDQVVLFVYLGGIVFFGCYFSVRNTTSKQFMDAGGSLPGWIVGMSIFGTFLSRHQLYCQSREVIRCELESLCVWIIVADRGLDRLPLVCSVLIAMRIKFRSLRILKRDLGDGRNTMRSHFSF